MKRWLVCLLCLALLMGCGASREEMDQPVRFYYCHRDSQTGTYGGETGALAWETRDLGPSVLPASEILELYLQGPADHQLVSPFPVGLKLRRASLYDGVLTVDLSDELLKLTGIDRTMAVACLVQTLVQFSDISSVTLLCNEEPFWNGSLNMDEFLLLDDTATSNAVTMKLYFAGPDGRYLVEETRSNSFQSENEIPQYVLQQLLEGPKAADGIQILPDGTRILDVQNENGVCTVNLSESFLWYQPSTHIKARLAVLSVVNALTELPEIACVQFLCGGNPINYYMGLDLSAPIYRDETAIGGDGRECADVTLYVPCGFQERLAPVPMELERPSDRVQVSDVLSALLSVETINSYVNPFPEGTMVLASEVEDGLCTVTFNAAFAMCDSDPSQAQKAVRSVVTTLCELDGIEQVFLEIHNGKMSSVDLAEPMKVDAAWLLP